MRSNAERCFYAIENVGGGVANEKNLIPFTERTESEVRELNAKGGRKSGETRRRKKAMRDAMKELLSMPVMNTKIYNATAMMGVEPENIDNQAAILCSLILNAQTGNVLAAKEVRSIIGEDNETARIKLQKEEFKLKKQKYIGDDEEIADDGFIDALNGTAAEDWTEDEES